MKFSLLWSALLVLLITCVRLQGATSISLSDSSGNASDVLDVPVRLTTDDRIAAMQTDIVFDPAIFSVSTVSAGDDLGEHSLRFNVVQPGLVRVVITSMENDVLGGGELFRVQGSLLADADSSNALDLSALIMSDESGVRVGYAFAPFISILSPSGVVSPGEELEIQAVAFSQSNNIDEVEIFVNGQSLGIFSEGPFVVSWTPLEAGSALLTAVVRASDGSEASAEAVDLIVEGSAIAGIDSWLEQVFTPEQQADANISGLFVDPDGDGLLNIFEYATGTLPLAFTPGTDLPQAFFIDINENTYLALRYRLRAFVTDIVAEVQVSDQPDFPAESLATPVLVESLLFGDYFLNVERDSVPIGNTLSEGRYIRLLITQAAAP